MIEDILEEIFSFRTLKRRKDIEDLKLIYNLLGTPCKYIKTIHIAGTNGKGSTAAYIEGIFLAEKYNVGKFTSPHILKYNERIIFNRDIISDEEIIRHYNTVKNLVDSHNKNIANKEENITLNFFEITTFIALLFFEEKKSDFIILETGLGGRLDATNIVDSDIAVITNISFDHTNILGNSLKDISYEKAGIIKSRQLCIYSDCLPELKKEITLKTDNSINVIRKYNDMEIELDKRNYRTIVKFHNSVFSLPLFGKFQAYNFLPAYEIAKIYDIDDKTIQRGLDTLYWPARFEIFSKEPTVILDAAHNDDSIKKLIENLEEIYNKNEVIIITSLLSTKDFEAVFKALEGISDRIYITSLKDIVYGLTSKEIRQKMISLGLSTENIIFQDDISIAYEDALATINKSKKKKEKENNTYKAIVICGSFYEISKFKSLTNGIK